MSERIERPPTMFDRIERAPTASERIEKPPTALSPFAALSDLPTAASSRRFHDQHRPWRKLYSTAQWKRTREYVLARDPLCKICGVTPSTIVDHIVDHKGDLTLFHSLTNCRGLCKECHDVRTSESEKVRKGTAPQPAVTADGKIISYDPK